eukprot:3921388-Rhodomonas_salina.1
MPDNHLEDGEAQVDGYYAVTGLISEGDEVRPRMGLCTVVCAGLLARAGCTGMRLACSVCTGNVAAIVWAVLFVSGSAGACVTG